MLEEQPVLTPVTFDALPGWEATSFGHALEALRHSCDTPRKMEVGAFGHHVTSGQWQSLCTQAQQPVKDAKAFFEAHFTPYHVTTTWRDTGLLTGYFTPTLSGSLTPSEQYITPVLAPPTDPTLRTRYSRREIENGALSGKELEILWLDDPVAAFFLHIQGSGLVQLENGGMKKLVYAGKNEFPYTPIGRQFVEDGIVEQQDMSMQWLIEWLRRHPESAADAMQRNASYIFFALEEVEEEPMVNGAEGSPLTPMHSIAIDPDYIGYGTVCYLHAPEEQIATLAVAQDTGSAIKGMIRADLYVGMGDDAATLAGRLKDPLQFYVLLPKQTEPREEQP